MAFALICSMSLKFGISSGTYNVRQTELHRDVRPLGKLLRCRVHFLDDSEGYFDIDVCSFLHLNRTIEHFHFEHIILN